jgi:hypothetical protein
MKIAFKGLREAVGDIMHIRNLPWRYYDVVKDGVYETVPRD